VLVDLLHMSSIFRIEFGGMIFHLMLGKTIFGLSN